MERVAGGWLGLLVVFTVLGTPTSGTAQTCEGSGGDAREVASQFFHALGRLQWAPVAENLHSEAILRFDYISRNLVGGLQGDSVLSGLYQVSRTEFDSWTARERFERSMNGMTEFARGLMESQVSTDVTLLGEVAEGELCHIVYRESTDHMAIVLEAVRVVTLRVERGRWTVFLNQELGVLETALRGVPMGRRPPPNGISNNGVP